MLPIEREISNSIQVLKSGGLLLYPTDTIWGIGCDATNPEAVEKIYRLKNRTDSKSLIILLDKAEKILNYIRAMPEIAWDLIDFAESPLTIIYPDAMNLAANVIADDHSVAIRIVKDEFCRRLIRAFGKPIVSTSANISGTSSPLNFKNITLEIKEGVDYIVDQAFAHSGQPKPSQILKLEINGEFRIIRQ